MAPQTKGSVSSFITSAADAPIWKSYLALRSLTPKNNLMNVSNFGNQSSSNGNLLPLKRVKLLSCRSDVHGPGHAIWMKLNTPLTKQRSDTKDGLAVVISVRDYWKHLSVNERQQILLVDDPELVKQLYKLNIGLLCVGLMQRHLKAVNRLSTSKSKTVVPQRSSSISGLLPTVACILDQVVTLPSTQAATQNSPIEKTYDLLEAMEFLNVDTGKINYKRYLLIYFS